MPALNEDDRGIEPGGTWSDVDLEKLVADSGAQPVRSVEDLERFAADIWESDEELDDFLTDLRTSRN